MENGKPKTNLGRAFASFGTRLDAILTLGGRVRREPQASRQTQKPANDKQPSLTTRQQRRRVLIAARRHGRHQRVQRTLPHKKFLNAFLLALGAIGSLVGLYMFVVPRISIASSNALDPSDPFSTPFTISNDGYFTVYDVEYSCGMDKVRQAGNISIEGPSIVNGDDLGMVGNIGPMEKAMVHCSMPFVGSPTLGANVTIDIAFRPSFYPFKIERHFRLITLKDSQGQLHWFQQPLGK